MMRSFNSSLKLTVSKSKKKILKNLKTLNTGFLNNLKELRFRANLTLRKKLSESASAKRNFHQKMECWLTLKSWQDQQLKVYFRMNFKLFINNINYYKRARKLELLESIERLREINFFCLDIPFQSMNAYFLKFEYNYCSKYFKNT